MTTRTTICFLLAAFILTINPAARATQETADLPGDIQIEQTETGFYYTVKKGDTLWDLSQRFLDSSWVWPGLWNENKQIPNPHLIYPGQKIRLYLKKDVDATSMAREIKESIPEKTPSYYFKEMDKTGFALSEMIKPAATVLRSTDSDIKTLMSEGEEIFIMPENGAMLNVGDLLLSCKLIDTMMVEEKGDPVYQYFVTGLTEVTGTGDGYAKALVTRSYRSLGKEDLLIPYVRKNPELPLIEKKMNLTGTILKAEENQQIFSDGAFAFIDKGIKDGVKEGQIYSVFKEDLLITAKSKNAIKLPTKDFGSILVLRAEESASTVVILKSTDSLEPGVKFH